MRHICKIFFAAAAFACAAAISVSCGKDDVTASLTVPLTKVPRQSGSEFIQIDAPKAWTLKINISPDEEEGWLWASDYSGKGSGKTVLHWKENESGKTRSAAIVLSCGNLAFEVIFTQNSNEAFSENVPQWMELPDTDQPGHIFVTHDMAFGTGRFRNFSYYLDPDARVSVWVAYPLTAALQGSGGRTFDDGEPWINTVDPKVPRDYQAVVTNAFRGGWARGHQCPSADRLRSDANFKTFYGTNITPQDYDLNGGAWVDMETKVRNWMISFDTLYVVTGADINGYTSTASDTDGKRIAVPVGYYKALLGYKRGASGAKFPGQVAGYVAVGFYFKNQSYYGNFLTDTSCKMSIQALENKLGYDFFVNLPFKIGGDNAKKVETTVSTFWK